MDEVRKRLDGMKRQFEARGGELSELRFRGVPLSELSRDDLEIIIANASQRQADVMSELQESMLEQP